LNTRESDGLGLGLPISKAIPTEHGGTIEYENGAQIGVIFIANLPILSQDVSLVANG